MKKLLAIFTSLIFLTSFAADNPAKPSSGGTGVNNNDSYTITLGGAFSSQGALTFSGLYPATFNLLASTNITFPSSGTLITSAGSYANPAWITSLDGGKLTGTVTANAIAAGTYGISISGNAGTVTNGVYTTDVGTVTNTMLAGSIADSKLNTLSTAGKVANSATTATNANTASAIVARDASGNFSAGTITAALSGNSSTATTLQTARTINGVSFDGSSNITITAAPSGSASGDLSGTYPNPTVAKINGNTLGSTTPTSGNALLGNGTQWVSTAIPTSISGTANEVIASSSTGAVTLSTPQRIDTGATPFFAAMTLDGAASGLNFRNNTITFGDLAPLNWLGLDSGSGAVFYGRLHNDIVSNTAGTATSKTTMSVQEGTGVLTDYQEWDGSTGTIHFDKPLILASQLSAQYLKASTDNFILVGGTKLDTVQDIKPTSVMQLAGLNLISTNNSLGLNVLTTAQFTAQTLAQGEMAFTTDSLTPIFYDGASNQLVASQSWANGAFVSLTGSYANPLWITTLSASKIIGQLPAGKGGTGSDSSSWSLGDVPYISATGVWNHLAGNTTTTRKFLRQTGNGTTSAAPAWDTIAAADVPGSALTKTDDTNVTLTLGGSPTTALLNAASITAGWTGQLGLTRGGSNASLTASNGGIVYSTASAMAILSGTATAGKVLQSGLSAAPSWSTPTYPSASGSAGKILRADGTNNVYSTSTFADTYSASNLLYSNGANTVQGLATGNSGVLVTSSSGVPSISTTLPQGLTIGSSALSGTTPAISFSSAISDGNYISWGSNGINFGLDSSNRYFQSFNLNYDATANSFKYALNQSANLIRQDTNGFSVLVAPSGTAGNAATLVSAFNVADDQSINLPLLTANGSLWLGSTNQITSIPTANNATYVTDGSGNPSFGQTLPTAVQSNITQLGTLNYVANNTGQPAFYSYANANLTNVTGDGTTYTIIFNTKSFDQHTDYNTSTGIFTAPVTGNYQCDVGVKIANMTTSHTVGYVNLVVAGTSAASYEIWNANPVNVRDANNNLHLGRSVLVHMTAADTAKVQVTVSNGTKVVTVKGSALTGEQSEFSCFLQS